MSGTERRSVCLVKDMKLVAGDIREVNRPYNTRTCKVFL